MGSPFAFRAGTNDADVFSSVVTRNEYRLPARLEADAVIIDIGAHIGSFTYAALMRGARVVYAFEPEPRNFHQARQNLAGFGEAVVLANRAVWRSDQSDREGPSLRLWPSSDTTNLGGGSVVWDADGPIVESIRFDEAVRAVTSRHRRDVDLLKIDCEGAEFPILLTSATLGQIRRIAGEYHELRAPAPAHAAVPGCAEFTLDVLVKCLTRAGFDVDAEKQATGAFGDLGLFFATKKTAAEP